jgi:hypothetical protein
MAEQETSSIEATRRRQEPRDQRDAEARLSTEELPRLDEDLGRVELTGLLPSWREFLRAPNALLTYLRSVALRLT